MLSNHKHSLKFEDNTSELNIRKLVTFDEETLIEGFRVAEKPWRMIAVAAVINNPWAGHFV
jgi:hypothetical protein